MVSARLILTLICAVLFGCSALTAPQARVFPPLVVLGPTDRAVASTIVLLAKERPYQWNGLVCAGVWVAPHRVLTAYHCIIPAAFDELDQKASDMGLDPPLNPVGQAVRFVNHDEWLANADDDDTIAARYQIHANVLKVDADSDLALIDTTETAPAYVEIATSRVKMGQPVFTVGHPSGLAYSYSRGYVSNPVRTLSSKELLYTQVNISIWHGNSGGGLYDDAGRLVGICSAMHSRNPSISFFVSLGPINKLVAGVSLKFS